MSIPPSAPASSPGDLGKQTWVLETATSEIRTKSSVEIYFQGLEILDKGPFMEPCASLPSNSFLTSLINEI